MIEAFFMGIGVVWLFSKVFDIDLDKEDKEDKLKEYNDSLHVHPSAEDFWNPNK